MTVLIYPPMLSMQLHMTSCPYAVHIYHILMCTASACNVKLFTNCFAPFLHSCAFLCQSQEAVLDKVYWLARRSQSRKSHQLGGNAVSRQREMGSQDCVHHPMAVLARRLFLGPYTVLLIIFASTAAAACPLCMLPAVLMTGCSQCTYSNHWKGISLHVSSMASGYRVTHLVTNLTHAA